jgi:hypothetical protein
MFLEEKLLSLRFPKVKPSQVVNILGTKLTSFTKGMLTVTFWLFWRREVVPEICTSH